MTVPTFFRVYTVAAAKAALSVTDVGISLADQDSYGPFDVVYVVNTSNQLIGIRPDGDSRRDMLVPGLFALTFDIQSYKHLSMINYDTGMATSGPVYVSVLRRSP